MKPADVKHIVEDTPDMSLKQAMTVTDFIHENGCKDLLELGFGHGVSACYMAAALEEAGSGSLVTIDLELARDRVPNIEQLLEKCGYLDKVEFYYEPISYTWRMMKFLEEGERTFDFCYIDGAHNWFVDGFAFLLVDRLLRPGGWIVFDDLNWSYAATRSLCDTDWVRAMPQDVRETTQIRKVYDLLVRTHPCYDDFQVLDGWAYAHKVRNSVADPAGIRSETVYMTRSQPITLKSVVSRIRRAATGK